MSPSQPTSAPADFMIRFGELRRQEAAAFTANKREIFDGLTAAGVGGVTVEFDGGGDSGQIESIQARNPDGEEVDLPAVAVSLHTPSGLEGERAATDVPLSDAIEHLAYEALSQTHCGWENNEGGFGTFTFDVPGRRLQLTMNARVVEILASEHEL